MRRSRVSETVEGSWTFLMHIEKPEEQAIAMRESRIPELAADAVKQARKETLASGRSVVEAVDGKLIESHPDGTQRVLKPLPAPTPVAVGQKKIRKAV